MYNSRVFLYQRGDFINRKHFLNGTQALGWLVSLANCCKVTLTISIFGCVCLSIYLSLTRAHHHITTRPAKPAATATATAHHNQTQHMYILYFLLVIFFFYSFSFLSSSSLSIKFSLKFSFFFFSNIKSFYFSSFWIVWIIHFGIVRSWCISLPVPSLNRFQPIRELSLNKKQNFKRFSNSLNYDYYWN